MAVGLVLALGGTSGRGGVEDVADEELPDLAPFVQTFSCRAQTIDGPVHHIATIGTNIGTTEFKLATDALDAVNNFTLLTGKSFYVGRFEVRPT
ncbi:MAG: hypothetical protein IH957_00450 [Chloroflexi bacterium]|nr:hypothetical protein [Chloroflexota bacterium]